MDIEVKYQNCKIHTNFKQNLFLFEQDNFHPKICLACAKKLTKNLNRIVDVDEFLHADESYIFTSFPPLEDEDIYHDIQQIKTNSFQEMFIKKIEKFFASLKEEINQKIDLIKNQTKAKLVSFEDLNSFNIEEFIKDYNQISSKFDIQNIYKKQYNTDSEDSLKEIIKERYQNIKHNTHKLQQYTEKYKEITNVFDLEQSFQIQQKILDLIDQISFFNKKPVNSIETIEFEKSQVRFSQQLAIQRIQNKQIQIKQTKDGRYILGYLNFVLDPMKKYIFRARLQTHSNNNNQLFVGIIQEQYKQNSYLHDGICYCERGDQMTIKKVIKGNNVYEGFKENIDKEIEVRIHLAEKMIRVANYPNYENVAELENKSLIEDNTQYRFAVQLGYSDHSLTITHFSIINQFDSKM